MKKKIVLIGAGSAMFLKLLITDMLIMSKERSWQLALVDIDEKAMDTARKLAQRMIAATKDANIELTYSTDRKDVLAGADYVVSTIGVGGRRAWEQDVFIPRKYGVYQPVGDTVMAGGISRAMRMIPAMVDIVKDIQKLCPDAYLFNFSNPMTMVCRGVRKATGFPIIGLCHSINSTECCIAGMLNVDRKELTSYGIGLNHLTFIHTLLHNGKDAFPQLKEKIKEIVKTKDITKAGTVHVFSDHDLQPFAWELLDIYSAYPAPGDRHIVEFFPERFPNFEYFGRKLGVDVYSLEKATAFGDKEYEEMIHFANSTDPLPESFFDRGGGEHEQLLDIISSFENDGRKVFSVNLPNKGIVPNLPYDAVLEMPALATGKGFMPLACGEIPELLRGILTKHISIAEMAAEAALKGDKNLMVEAVLLGGYINDRKKVISMVDELLTAHKDNLPQF